MTDERLSPIPKEAREFQGNRAGLVTRCVANTIDAAVVGVVLLLGYLGMNAFLFMLDPRGFSLSGSSVLLSILAGSIVLVVYFTAAWATTGRTYGDHLMGLRVVDRRDRRLHLPGSFVRALFCVYFPIGLVWCVISPSRRSVQDVVLRTSVRYDWSQKPLSTRRAPEGTQPHEA